MPIPKKNLSLQNQWFGSFRGDWQGFDGNFCLPRRSFCREVSAPAGRRGAGRRGWRCAHGRTRCCLGRLNEVLMPSDHGKGYWEGSGRPEGLFRL